MNQLAHNTHEPEHDKTNKMTLAPWPYMWSLPIWRKPPDMEPPFTPSRRGSKNPDIYEFRFFAFSKS